MKYPGEVQDELLKKLLSTAKRTHFGKEYEFDSIKSFEIFKQRVPVQTYEDIYPYIHEVMQGAPNVLWPSDIKWFAKSSGTTNDQSKFIPVSQEAIEDCHFKGGKDMLALYCNNYPETQLFTGKGLALGGSHQINQLNGDSFYGDLSAVLMQNLPSWAQMIRTPELSIALLDDWEDKIEKIARHTIKEDVVSIAGVPTWTLVLLNWILDYTGKNNIHDIWPNLEVYYHGGVSFVPYRSQFEQLLGKDFHFMETYNASEGFFGIQDQPHSEDMLMMLDYGIFFEFVPLDELGKKFPISYSITEVEMNVPYAVVITTNAGLWRYLIGDTVRFTSLDPVRFKIVGRTRLFINAFGEELMIENADFGIEEACRLTDAEVVEYTAAPIYMEAGKRGGHEWLVEFKKAPNNMETFVRVLDESMQQVNSDYRAKRAKDIALAAPLVKVMPSGTFYDWLKRKGKLGGQHKVPRLSNQRTVLEEILNVVALEEVEG